MLENIIADAMRMLQVSPEAANEFEAKNHELVNCVNQRLSSLADIADLIGHSPQVVMEENHRNHGMFMAAVFKDNAFGLLAKTIPWAYRVYHSKGFSYDYFKLELRAWIGAVEMELSELHAGQITAVYEWMFENHERMIAISDSVRIPVIPYSQPEGSRMIVPGQSVTPIPIQVRQP
jgi:MerR family transcriptional regulator, light-induced transcriptional regulator